MMKRLSVEPMRGVNARMHGGYVVEEQSFQVETFVA
jgi:hypothetical protein